MTTKIEWCDETINPIIGCKRQCSYCYASRQAMRLARFPHTAERYAGIAEGGKWTGLQRFIPSELEKLERWQRPRRVFIGSMGDLGDAQSSDFDAVLDAVARAQRHTCVILTKNPARMSTMLGTYYARPNAESRPLPNLILGTSVEDQPTADERIPLLLATPAARRAVSYEPALGPIDLDADWLMPRCNGCRCHVPRWQECPHDCRMAPLDTPHLSWVIAGAETGPGKRPAELGWFRSVRDQCKAAGVPFFMKKTSDGDPPEDLMIHELPW